MDHYVLFVLAGGPVFMRLRMIRLFRVLGGVVMMVVLVFLGCHMIGNH